MSKSHYQYALSGHTLRNPSHRVTFTHGKDNVFIRKCNRSLLLTTSISGGQGCLRRQIRWTPPVKASRSHLTPPGGCSALPPPMDQLGRGLRARDAQHPGGRLFYSAHSLRRPCAHRHRPTDEGSSTALRLLEHTEVKSKVVLLRPLQEQRLIIRSLLS